MRLGLALFFFGLIAHAESMVNFSYKDGEVRDMIANYSKLSGKKFVVDPSVRGRADILNDQKVSLDEAFALMSSALALNGFAITLQGDTYVVQTARNVQRSYLQVTSELPAMKPERMVSYLYTTKFLPAQTINQNLRILASKDGEIIPVGANKILLTDWASNLHRISQTLAMIDRADTKLEPKPAKSAKASTTD